MDKTWNIQNGKRQNIQSFPETCASHNSGNHVSPKIYRFLTTPQIPALLQALKFCKSFYWIISTIEFQPLQKSHLPPKNNSPAPLHHSPQLRCVKRQLALPLPQINCWTTTGNTKDKSTSSAGLNKSSSPLPWMYSEGNLALHKAWHSWTPKRLWRKGDQEILQPKHHNNNAATWSLRISKHSKLCYISKQQCLICSFWRGQLCQFILITNWINHLRWTIFQKRHTPENTNIDPLKWCDSEVRKFQPLVFVGVRWRSPVKGARYQHFNSYANSMYHYRIKKCNTMQRPHLTFISKQHQTIRLVLLFIYFPTFSEVDQIEFHWINRKFPVPPQKKQPSTCGTTTTYRFFCFVAKRLNGAFTVSIDVNETSLTTVARDQHVVHVIEVKGLRDRPQCSLVVVANVTRNQCTFFFKINFLWFSWGDVFFKM